MSASNWLQALAYGVLISLALIGWLFVVGHMLDAVDWIVAARHACR